MTSLRSRVAPRYTLNEKPIFLATFFAKLGALIYERDWKNPDPSVGAKANDTPFSDSFLAEETRAQTLFALEQGVIKVQARVRMEGLIPLRPIVQTGRYAPIVEDDGDNAWDGTQWWTIDQKYWQDARVDWSLSKVWISPLRLTAESLIRKSFSCYFEDLPEVVEAEVFVMNWRSALGRATPHDPLPSDVWFERYNKYVDVIYKEGIAAAWRHIAMHSGDKIKQADIVSYMLQYLSERGLITAGAEERPRKSLEVIASKILRQLQSGAEFEAVFVNSARNPRQVPKPELS